MENHFTILLASHNRLSLLKKAVRSALLQDYPLYEILIIDDGSRDKTRKWLMRKEFLHPRIKVIFLEHTGVANARQVGLSNARYEYVCILDSDDVIVPSYLRIINDKLNINPHLDFIYTNNTEIYQHKQAARYSNYNFTNRNILKRDIMIAPRIPYKHSGTVLKRKRILDTGGYDISLKIKIDIDLILRAISNNLNIGFIPSPLVTFYSHSDSLSIKRLKGIITWCHLINKYYNGHPVSKVFFILIRCYFEFLKLLVFSFRRKACFSSKVNHGGLR